jgi:hypothetical protein
MSDIDAIKTYKHKIEEHLKIAAGHLDRVSELEDEIERLRSRDATLQEEEKFGRVAIVKRCPTCKGTGRLGDECRCGACLGQKEIVLPLKRRDISPLLAE